MGSERLLWYRDPAKRWTEALPIGNGRLGAMIFGGIWDERIQLNEDSLWSGGFRDRNNPEAKEAIPQIRALLDAGRISEAEDLARFSLTGTPEFQRAYQTLGELQVHFHGVCCEPEEYVRSLNLENAVSTVCYKLGKYKYGREVFASAPSDVIAMRLFTDNPDGMSFDARLVRNRICERSGKIGENTVFVDGVDGISFCCMMTGMATRGEMSAVGEYLVFNGVKEAVLYITASTGFRCTNPEASCISILEAARKNTYADLKNGHIADYKAYESLMSLEFKADESLLPTDERLARFAEGFADIGLIQLYFRYGRYLLISGSRPGTLPVNLQGIWCGDFLPPWDSKYTININTQMNYWLAETCNLSECHFPLFDHIKRMHTNGTRTAREMYGARGFVAHHNTDIWGDTAPQDTYVPATYWVMGAAWLCLHIWEHYQYTLDEDFLRGHFYLLRDASLFFMDLLIQNTRGEMIVSPTVSPENTYILPDGTRGRLCAGCAMDSQILAELFEACIGACRVLRTEPEFAKELEVLAEKLPPARIGANGTIQEWTEDYEEAEPGHRHVSHLFALFPGTKISLRNTPELAEAAKLTLERRLSHGGGHTGWSRAWITNFWARLGDAEKAAENIDLLLSKSTLPNLFDNHPPFQIDGNFGGAAAIANMLLQSEPEVLYILPALPQKWSGGKVFGLKAKGGLTVGIEWENGELERISVASARGYTGKAVYRGMEVHLSLAAGAEVSLDKTLRKV